ncbi:MAG: aminotransferase class I/II-fold pyridoxal phosphate-dependent enzyme [Bacteroidales bacterium]|jgi:dTDP-4-amino-4,6-dideoxygalactose transaminase|nr:aminotransferase class I/II-fold pyridoxal phosphate-dependent enzyme [Bacteroidales bacterium]
MAKNEKFYKAELARILQSDPSDIFLYWKGRVALYALLRAMNVGKDDEVIIPAFTCVVVANAVKYLGAKPIYVDIDPATYNMDVNQLEAHISPKTKVIVCQNTFGLSSNLEKIIKIAQVRDVFTIEDCTHGFGGMYTGKPNGTFCDAAFYSTQWNKPFSTGIGGFAISHHKAVKENLLTINNDLIKASVFNNFSLSILYLVREHIMINQFYWMMLKAYRWLSHYNLVQGSSSGQELIGTAMPKNYFKGVSKVQVRKGIKNLRSLPATIEIRKSNAEKYTDYLRKENKNHVAPEWFADHSFLVYPLRVKNRDEVFKIAELRKVPLGDWFCSPLHPVSGQLEQWDLDETKYPNACEISRQIVNLPTNPPSIEPILAFLAEIKDSIL